MNNYIQKDRYHESRYLAEKSMLTIGEDQSYALDTECIQNASIMDTEVRLELGKSKDRLELSKESKGADKPPTRSRFVPPTVDEVRAYCQQRQNGIDAALFVDFYEARGWTAGRGKMRDWKAAVRTWERREKKAPEGAAPPVKRGTLTVGEDGEEAVEFA